MPLSTVSRSSGSSTFTAGWSRPGHWRDYAIHIGPDVAVFAAFRRTSERPEVRIEKRPALRLKQGAFALVGEHGLVLKRGQELHGILAPIERRLMRLVEE